MGNLAGSQPLISIVITTYKRKERLKQAILSALSQTYNNVEILVIDDNIKNTEYRTYVENLMIDFPSVKYIKNEKNIGGALARNVGIDAALGEFIAFLDDDDLYGIYKLERQYNCYMNHILDNVGLIYCYSAQNDSFGKKIGAFENDKEGNPIFEHMLDCIAGTSLWFCPKQVLVKVGKFEDTPSKQDSILLLKILGYGYNIFRVPEILVNYTEHNDERISGMKVSNIVGICNFREWCRKNYSKISKVEREKIEFNFSKILIPIYLFNGIKREAYECLFSMFKISFFSKETSKAIIKCFCFPLYKGYLQKQKKSLSPSEYKEVSS